MKKKVLSIRGQNNRPIEDVNTKDAPSITGNLFSRRKSSTIPSFHSSYCLSSSRRSSISSSISLSCASHMEQIELASILSNSTPPTPERRGKIKKRSVEDSNTRNLKSSSLFKIPSWSRERHDICSQIVPTHSSSQPHKLLQRRESLMQGASNPAKLRKKSSQPLSPRHIGSKKRPIIIKGKKSDKIAKSKIDLGEENYRNRSVRRRISTNRFVRIGRREGGQNEQFETLFTGSDKIKELHKERI